MARKKKKEAVTEEPVVSRSVQIKLEMIAQRLGTSVGQLLENYGRPEDVIEKFDSGELQLLNE